MIPTSSPPFFFFSQSSLYLSGALNRRKRRYLDSSPQAAECHMCLFWAHLEKKCFRSIARGSAAGLLMSALQKQLLQTWFWQQKKPKKLLQSIQKRRRKYKRAAFKAGRLQLSRLKTNLKTKQQPSTCSLFRPVTLARVVHHLLTGISLMPMTTSHSDLSYFHSATFSRPLLYFSRCYIYRL